MLSKTRNKKRKDCTFADFGVLTYLNLCLEPVGVALQKTILQAWESKQEGSELPPGGTKASQEGVPPTTPEAVKQWLRNFQETGAQPQSQPAAGCGLAPGRYQRRGALLILAGMDEITLLTHVRV